MTVPDILFFIPKGTEASERLEHVAGSFMGRTQVDIVSDIEGLRLRLLQSSGVSRQIVVLLAPTRGDLNDLARVGDTFFDRRVVLILPDGDDETVAVGHGLRPRFISYAADFPEIEPVLRKMIGNGLSG